MLKLCEDIDTLAMMMLDGELAPQEQRDVELHVLDCASCKAHLEREGAAMETRRRLLAPPPAPMLLRAKVTRALDEVDRAARPRARRLLLPVGAMAAAAAALIVFVAGVRAPDSASTATGGPRRPSPPVVLDPASNGPLDPTLVPAMEYQRAGLERLSRHSVLLHYGVGVPNGRTYDVRVQCGNAEGSELPLAMRRMIGPYEVWVRGGDDPNVIVRDGDLIMVLGSKSLSADGLLQLIGGTSLVKQVRADATRR